MKINVTIDCNINEEMLLSRMKGEIIEGEVNLGCSINNEAESTTLLYNPLEKKGF